MVVFWACICTTFVTLASAAPFAEDLNQDTGYLSLDNGQIDYLRGHRSSNNQQYISPCAAAAASSAHFGTIVPEPYHRNLIPSQARYAYPAGYAGNFYRTEDPFRDDRELLSFSDMDFMDHSPMARYNYGAAAAASPSYAALSGANLAGLGGQVVGPAYGVFPNANVGGCNVPLLFSCSPSVVPGRIVKADSHGAYSNIVPASGGQPDSYRGVEEHYLHPKHEEQVVHEQLVPVKSDVSQTSEKHL